MADISSKINTFYNDACDVDSKMTPYPVNTTPITIDDNGLVYHIAKSSSDGSLKLPHSIMNDNVAINYRTIYNGYPLFSTEKSDFTEYSDYERCMSNDQYYASYLQDKRNPTYTNIMKYYNNEELDKFGLARYKMQDFLYLKYYNQIPNNYMVTLRRYTRPCEDHMFGLDMSAEMIKSMNNYNEYYIPIATAVTYMGEKAGNKLSDIMKFDYGANWEDKEGKTESLQNPDGGLAAQMKKGNIDVMSRLGGSNSTTAQLKSMLAFSTMSLGKGVSVSKAMSAQYQYEGNAFNARYGEELYGDVNVVNKVKIRSRGLTFSNSFTLNFEYSLKSLKCVNPRIAMMDILSNFFILTGNYGTFWGGATIFYGNRNIAPQYGDPELLRNGKYGDYIRSLVGDVTEGFKKISGNEEFSLSGVWEGIKNIASGGLQALVGNLLGGNIGEAGEAIAPQALLSGAPSGFWHVTVGNPLDPIAMMGNMAVTKTTVQFGDALGYDDFPTEVKFTVELEHCRPRDNGGMEAMFNGGKGRFYSFTNPDLMNAYHNVDTMANFQANSDTSGKTNKYFDHNGNITNVSEKHTSSTNEIMKTVGGFLNG